MDETPKTSAQPTMADWAHRLTVLRAWEYCEGTLKGGERPADRFVNRAVKDGCAVTLRTTCYVLGVSMNFKESQDEASVTAKIVEFAESDRTKAAFPQASNDELINLGDVLFLANRAVAHLEGVVQHKVSPRKLAAAINLVLARLADSTLPGLVDLRSEMDRKKQPAELFHPLKIEDYPST